MTRIRVALLFIVASYTANATFLQSTFTVAGNSEPTDFKKLVTDSQGFYQKAQSLNKEFAHVDLPSIESSISTIKSNVDSIKIYVQLISDNSTDSASMNHFQNAAQRLYLQVENTYEKMLFAKQIYLETEAKNDKLGTEYHNVWNNVFQYRNRVQKLFVKEEQINMHFGSLTDVEKVTVRKKNLYEAGIRVYDHYLAKVRNLKQCDYESRIKELRRAKAILVAIEELLYAEGTRPLEKSLKKDFDITSIEDKIFSFNTTD